MSYERLKPPFSLDADKLAELKRIVPEAFADGKINWETLKEALGEHLEEEGADAEHFGLFWPGKREARRLAAMPSRGTLVPVPGEGIDEETTRNIFIEGENLEVLKLLQKSYAGRIKMIYIDPPYNDGEDRVYEDDFREPLEEYLRRTGQVDQEGKLWTTNTRADGRFHSKWLTMMYPRFKVARNLLRDDGVIFVSIDDNEMNHLKTILDEIFGQENFEGHIHWRRRHNQPNDKTKMIALVAEHILAYSKNSQALKAAGVGKVDLTGDFANPDNDPRGDWASKPWKVGSDQSGSRYKIVGPTGKVFDEEWMGDEDTYKTLLDDKRIIFPKKGDGFPRKKYFRSEREEEGQCATNWWPHEQFGHNQGANDELAELFGKKNLFSNPKPTQLIRGLLQISNTKTDHYVLDFFAGSGSTAHAVMLLNQEDGQKRKFIMIQIPEPTDKNSEAHKEGYTDIAALCKERIRLASGKLKAGTTRFDLGMKVCKLTKSNYKIWQDYNGVTLADIEETLSLFETPLIDGWRRENLLSEISLFEGFPLDSKIKKLKEQKKNTVYHVSSDWCEHKLLVCLDEKVSEEAIKGLKIDENDVFVCLDSALDEQAKMRLADICKLKTI